MDIYVQVLNNVIQYAVWPSTLQQATINNLLRTDSTGNTRLSTTNGCAYAELAGHGEILTVAYLARVAQDRVDNCLTVEEREMVEDGVARLGLSEDGKKKENAEVNEKLCFMGVYIKDKLGIEKQANNNMFSCVYVCV